MIIQKDKRVLVAASDGDIMSVVVQTKYGGYGMNFITAGTKPGDQLDVVVELTTEMVETMLRQLNGVKDRMIDEMSKSQTYQSAQGLNSRPI